ncbi:MAG: formate dehydrogenase accessory sulfurtransferase FdhD [Clostridia bacterium]|nr:formate dehydrogenase accessory sulfurtransferase FdhD [Clostridia bacterium]
MNSLHNAEHAVMQESLLFWSLNGVRQSPKLCTARHQEELLAGGLVTEGRIASVSDVLKLDRHGDVYDVTARLQNNPPADILERLQRCQPVPVGKSVTPAEIKDLCAQLLAGKGSFGNHRAMLACEGQTIFREDIGRHNAVDKVIAACLYAGWDMHRCVLGSTGRLSLEMLCKAAMAGIPVFFSRKYPGDLAVHWAEKLNITLIGKAASDHLAVWGSQSHIV